MDYKLPDSVEDILNNQNPSHAENIEVRKEYAKIFHRLCEPGFHEVVWSDISIEVRAQMFKERQSLLDNWLGLYDHLMRTKSWDLPLDIDGNPLKSGCIVELVSDIHSYKKGELFNYRKCAMNSGELSRKNVPVLLNVSNFWVRVK